MGHIEIDFDFSGDESKSFKMGENCIINNIYGNDTVGEYLGNKALKKALKAILCLPAAKIHWETIEEIVKKPNEL